MQYLESIDVIDYYDYLRAARAIEIERILEGVRSVYLGTPRSDKRSVNTINKELKQLQYNSRSLQYIPLMGDVPRMGRLPEGNKLRKAKNTA